MGRHPTTGLRVLLVAWVVVAACFPILGERRTAYADLVHAVQTQHVQAVTVEGDIPSGGTGSWTATIHWRDGLRRRYADVRQVIGHTDQTTGQEDGVTTIGRSVVTDLHTYAPDLTVHTRVQRPHAYSSAFGWQGPWPLGVAMFAVWAVTLGAFLGARDEPPWATRWGWGWWILSPLFLPTLVLWLVAMIHAERVGRPAQVRGRLTGGWSFILSLLFTSGIAAAIGLG